MRTIGVVLAVALALMAMLANRVHDLQERVAKLEAASTSRVDWDGQYVRSPNGISHVHEFLGSPECTGIAGTPCNMDRSQ